MTKVKQANLDTDKWLAQLQIKITADRLRLSNRRIAWQAQMRAGVKGQ